jgi:hypothetical protein
MMSASDDLDTTAIALGACSLQMFRPLDILIDDSIMEDQANSMLEGANNKAIDMEVDQK